MKKSIFLITLASVIIGLVGCEQPTPPTDPTVPVKDSIKLESDSIELFINSKYTLSPILPDSTTQVYWESDNTNIATVDAEGTITAIAEGCAIITVSAKDLISAQCYVIVTPMPESFPRKFVIEHFTGDQCGYCPGGMYAITEHIATATTPYIWLSHHEGYNKDEYTIPESSKIGKMLGVPGAPSIALNRTKQSPGLAFNPNYLSRITIQDQTTAAASVSIKHTYNPDSRQLDLTVSGYVLDTTVDQYLLSVLIKENRLVGKQADYQYSWKSATWKEYMHARVVRDFMTSHFGDTITINNQRYSKTWKFEINKEWVPENCCIVAYLTPLSKKPIINAEQAPLIAGTLGGEQYVPYGITEGKGPNKTIEFDSLQTKQLDNNILEVKLFASKSIKSDAYGATKAIGIIHLNTTSTTLSPGSYPIQEDNTTGTITAGYRMDEEATLGGSKLVYAIASDLAKGDINIAHQWRMASGTMNVAENGNITFDFKTYNGTEVTSTYTIVAE